MKMKWYKNLTSFVSPELPKAKTNKTRFNLYKNLDCVGLS